MSTMNRLANSGNRYQGDSKKVLCVCSAGLLRSPTIAWVLGNLPYQWNTRAAGYNSEYALIIVDDVLVTWADEIICADQTAANHLLKKWEESLPHVRVFDIPDDYGYKHPDLIKLIEEKAKENWPEIGER